MNKDQLQTIVAALTYSQPTARNYPEPAKRHSDALKFATDALAVANDEAQALAREIVSAVVSAEVRRMLHSHLASMLPQPTVYIANGEVFSAVSDEQVHVVLMDALHRVAERNGYPEWAHSGPPCNHTPREPISQADLSILEQLKTALPNSGMLGWAFGVDTLERIIAKEKDA